MRAAKTQKKGAAGRAAPRQAVDALIGLGPVSRGVLARAGIRDVHDLRRAGPVGAYVAAKAVEPGVSLNLLWGIAGALTDTHWAKLDPEFKASLLLEYDAYCDIHGPESSPSGTSSKRRRER